MLPGRRWLMCSLLTAAAWGTAGTFERQITRQDTPDTVIYVLWALLLIPVALYVLARNGWKLQHDRRSMALGLSVGAVGACGQMALFQAARSGPEFLILPLVSLAPAITIGLSLFLLGERTGKLGTAGIALALLALPLFDYVPNLVDLPGAWIYLAVGVTVLWGAQGCLIKFASRSMDAASIFFYLALSAVLFIPVALAMTDFSQPVHVEIDAAALVQILGAVGALTLVYAYSSGKAVVVAPLIGVVASLITAALSPFVTDAVQAPFHAVAIALAAAATALIVAQRDAPRHHPLPPNHTSTP